MHFYTIGVIEALGRLHFNKRAQVSWVSEQRIHPENPAARFFFFLLYLSKDLNWFIRKFR